MFCSLIAHIFGNKDVWWWSLNFWSSGPRALRVSFITKAYYSCGLLNIPSLSVPLCKKGEARATGPLIQETSSILFLLYLFIYRSFNLTWTTQGYITICQWLISFLLYAVCCSLCIPLRWKGESWRNCK